MPVLYDDEGNPVDVPDSALAPSEPDTDVKGLRKEIEAANKRLRDMEKTAKQDAEDAAAFRTAKRDSALAEHLGQYGPTAVEMWKESRTYGDTIPTPETAAEFAERFRLAPPQAAAPATTGLPAPGSGPTPFVFEPTTGGGPPMQQRVPKTHYDHLMRTNQRQEAGRLLMAGLVDGVSLPT